MLMDKLGVSKQRFTNWDARGVPPSMHQRAADADYDAAVTIGTSSASDDISGSSENFLWGVGLGYRAGQWTTRLEYQQAQDVGENSILGKADVSRIVLGAIYRF